MVTFRHIGGHIQVYDRNGRFLFSADSEQEAREEFRCNAEYQADYEL